MGNNPVVMVDPDGRMAWFVPVLIGAAFGGFSGWQIGKSQGAKGMDMLPYILGGAMFGAASGGVGHAVATSGIAFSQTLSIAASSTMFSAGMYAVSGNNSDIMTSFGAASYNWSTREFGFLGKKGNSFAENLGYGFGALANLSDLVAGFNGTKVELVSEKKDVISHSAVVNEAEGINVSVGPKGGSYFDKYQSFKGQIKTLFKKVDGVLWENHAMDGHGWKTPIHNLNKNILKKILQNIANGKNIIGKPLTYSAAFKSCVSYTSRSLWLTGIPNIGIHPYFLHLSVLARQLGIYSSPYLTHEY